MMLSNPLAVGAVEELKRAAEGAEYLGLPKGSRENWQRKGLSFCSSRGPFPIALEGSARLE